MEFSDTAVVSHMIRSLSCTSGSVSEALAQMRRMYSYFDYSCCIAEAGKRVHSSELFATFEYISSSLAVVISSAGRGKAELRLCCGSPASVKTSSEKASVSILLIMLRLHIP